jgi:hypothetical protein
MSAKSFITVKNNVLTGYHEGDMDADFFHTNYYGHEVVELPEGTSPPMTGDTLDFYDRTAWSRKSDTQLVDEGLIPMPEGYVREGDEIRKMTQEEKIIAGLESPQEGTKVLDGAIVPMTLEERRDAGLVTDEDYIAIKEGDVMAELNRRLAELNTEEAKAQAEIDEDYAAERKAKISELLAVKKQKGWPLDVEWPEE